MKQLFNNGSIMVTWTPKSKWAEEFMSGDSWYWAFDDNTGATYFCCLGLEMTVLNTPF